MFERRKLDHPEALLAAARGTGLDRPRFEIDLFSEAITEAFAADLDEVRGPPDAAREAARGAQDRGKRADQLPVGRVRRG